MKRVDTSFRGIVTSHEEITDNTENSLFDIAQEKIAIQDAFTRIENLSHSISETEKDRQDALRLILHCLVVFDQNPCLVLRYRRVLLLYDFLSILLCFSIL
jgi:hypothetical protein